MLTDDAPLTAELDVSVDAEHVRQLLALIGLDGPKVPASYVLAWLANGAIRSHLLRRNPPGCIPVLSRHRFSVCEELRPCVPYRLSAVVSKMPSKHPAMRIAYGVSSNGMPAMEGEVEVLFVPSAEIGGI